MFSLFRRAAPGTLRGPRGKISALASLRLDKCPNLAEAVALPAGVALDHWVAAHSLSALDSCEAVWELSADACTCAHAATAGVLSYRYKASDGSLLDLTAGAYFTRLLGEARSTVAAFPQDGEPLPPGFEAVASKLWSRLLRVFLHCLLEHGAAQDPIVRAAFSHFLAFGKAHGLIAPEELPATVADRLSAVLRAAAAP